MAVPSWLPWALGGLSVGALGYAIKKATTKRPVSDSSEPARTIPAGSRVVLVGDSLGVGLRAPLADLLSRTGITLVAADAGSPLVITGKTAKGILPVIEAHQQVLAGASLVLVSLGSNDAAMMDPHVEASSVQDLFALLGDGGRQVVWLVPPSFGLVASLVPKPATAAKQDAFEAMIPPDVEQIVPDDQVMEHLSTADHIHLTPDGYRSFAAQIVYAMTGVPLSA